MSLSRIRRGEFPAPRTIGTRPMWLEAEVADLDHHPTDAILQTLNDGGV